MDELLEQMRIKLKEASLIGPLSDYSKRFDESFDIYKSLILSLISAKETHTSESEQDPSYFPYNLE